MPLGVIDQAISLEMSGLIWSMWTWCVKQLQAVWVQGVLTWQCDRNQWLQGELWAMQRCCLLIIKFFRSKQWSLSFPQWGQKKPRNKVLLKQEGLGKASQRRKAILLMMFRLLPVTAWTASGQNIKNWRFIFSRSALITLKWGATLWLFKLQLLKPLK